MGVISLLHSFSSGIVRADEEEDGLGTESDEETGGAKIVHHQGTDYVEFSGADSHQARMAFDRWCIKIRCNL